MNRTEIAFTVNSPGEVSTWLIPTAAALRAVRPDLAMSVFILPCTYAAGTERDVVTKIQGIERVISPRESLAFALWGRRPRGFSPAARGALLFLGGEFALAARLVRRLGYAGAAYTEGYINSTSSFDRVYVPREQAAARVQERGVDPEAVRVVGDLMVDAALLKRGRGGRAPSGDGHGALDRALGEGSGGSDRQEVVALFPGSRPFEFVRGLSFFAEAAVHLSGHSAGARFVVALSPYVTAEVAERGLATLRERGGETDLDVEALFAAGAGRVHTAAFTLAGRRTNILFCRDTGQVMASADLALTIPGSNTAELAAWGVPMIVCLPLDRPEEIPVEGIFSFVDRIPVVGKKLKARVVLGVADRTEHTALPNRIAGARVVPELRSRTLSPETVAAEARKLLADDSERARMSHRLKEVMGKEGAAQEIARDVISLIDDA